MHAKSAGSGSWHPDRRILPPTPRSCPPRCAEATGRRLLSPQQRTRFFVGAARWLSARFRPEQAQQTQLNSSKFGKQASTGCASPERAASSAATINPRRAEPRKLSLIIGQYCLQVVRSSRSLHNGHFTGLRQRAYCKGGAINISNIRHSTPFTQTTNFVSDLAAGTRSAGSSASEPG